ncbi:MAG: hypothetical protein HQL06_15880 [Nitrospirae bacterium]|nr:hypothetical protein [Nitrospirota bacterium]
MRQTTETTKEATAMTAAQIATATPNTAIAQTAWALGLTEREVIESEVEIRVYDKKHQ